MPGSIGVELRAATAALMHSDSPRLDAELLLAEVLHCSRVQLITAREQILGTQEAARFAALISARAAGQPVAQLRGHQAFWSLDLEVNDQVLIPRPETELLVSLTLDRVSKNEPIVIADLGTGSGAVSLALALELPHALVVGIERAAGAIAVAARNRARLDVCNLRLIHGSWVSAIAEDCFDVVVSNPPYVEADDPCLTHALRFEPRHALAAGADGLDALREIAQTAPRTMRAGGWILLEHGARQGQAVRALLRDSGLQCIETVPDLSGLARVTMGQRK